MKHSRSILLMVVISIVSLNAPAFALPIIFTDRTAFDAVVGATIQVTFDSPVVFEPHINPDGTKNFDFGTATIDNLLSTGGDREIFVGMNDIPGSFCFCSTFGAGGFALGTISPVLAFAADITPLEPNALIQFAGSNFILTEPQFLGALFFGPTVTGVGETFGLTSPTPSRFYIDNVAIKTVPEPPTLLCLVFSVIALTFWKIRPASIKMALIIALMSSTIALPAHAIPITVDSASRSISAAALSSSEGSSTAALGLYNDLVSAYGTNPDFELNASASQASNVSVLSDVLLVNAVGAVNMEAVYLTPANPANQPTFTGFSGLAVTFSIDNWASYTAAASFNLRGNVWSFAHLANTNGGNDLFVTACELSCSENVNYSGLLSPGTYVFHMGTLSPFDLDPGSVTASYASSFIVGIVPEPSSLLFLLLGAIAVVGSLADRRTFRNYSGVLCMAALMALAGYPIVAEASPITPNPNPVGSTINIVNDQTASTGAGPFFLNAGTINNDSSSKLTISAPLANAGTLNNYGQVSQLNIINTGTINNFAGFTEAGNYGTLTNALGATLNNYGGIVMGPLGPALIANAGTVNNFSGSSIIGTFGGGSMSNTGSLNNFANATVAIYDGGFGNAVGATINNAGTMIIFLTTNDGTLINSGSFTCCTSGESFINTGTIINTGTFGACCHAFGNSGTVLNTSLINAPQIFNGGTLVNNGTITTDFNLASNSGLLRGNGTLNADLSHLSGGLLAPGDSSVLGKFTIHGNLQSSGDFLFRIQGLNVGQFDALDISDTATFSGGKMTFAFSGFDAKIGDSWDFLYASAISGWDSLTFLFTGLDPTERAMFHFHDGIETLRIVAVPEPGSSLLFGLGLGGLALLRKLKAV